MDFLGSGRTTHSQDIFASRGRLFEAPEKCQGETGPGVIRNDDANTLADQKTIVAIPAPPYKEKVRAEYYMKRLQALGLKDVQLDSEGNVFGLRPGTGKGPKIFVEAHLDTVFPEGTNTQPVERDGKIFAPGISDDTRGLAALLSILRASTPLASARSAILFSAVRWARKDSETCAA